MSDLDLCSIACLHCFEGPPLWLVHVGCHAQACCRRGSGSFLHHQRWWVTCQLCSDVLIEFNDNPVIEQIDVIKLLEDEFPVVNKFCGSVGKWGYMKVTALL